MRAKATRVGTWWTVEMPELEGVFTQARRLDPVEAQVIDAVRTMLEGATAEVVVRVVLALDGAAAVSTPRPRTSAPTTAAG